MDGLECKTERYSNLERTFRIDSEFYRKKNYSVLSAMKKLGISSLVTKVSVSDGNHMSISDSFQQEGIPYYRGQDTKSFFIESSSPNYISEETYNNSNLRRSYLKKGDVILSIVGTIGNLSLVYSDRQATCSCKLAILRPKENDFSEILAVFLSSQYGQNQIKKFVRGAVQMGLILDDIDQLVIPNFSLLFQKQIKIMVQLAYKKMLESENILCISTNVFISHLKHHSYENNSISIKSLLDSFYKSGRLDSEYYQLKYEMLENVVSSYANGSDTLQNLCNIYDSNFIPENNEDYKYIELANIKDQGQINDVEIIKGVELPSRARRIVNENKVLVSSIEGSLSSCALVTSEYDNAICSTGFYVIDSDKINPETLLIVLKSEPIQQLLKKRCSGTILTAINKDEFMQLPLPIVEPSIQKEIADLVKESFSLRSQAKQMLANAIKAVEMAIETDEEIAIRWLEVQHEIIIK